MVKRVLLVENEKQIARFIDLELQKEGYQVDVVEDGKAGLALIAATKYDLILFNYDLSDMSGETFAEEISRIRPASVLIVLDSREKIAEHKESIQRFAVSYMVKPFIISDLVDKITAIFRGRDYIDQHCSQMKIPTSYRNLRIDVEHHTVYRGKDMISLTRREYDLLATLMGSKGVVTRDQLLESVWKYESTGETNIVDVYIRHLHSAVEKFCRMNGFGRNPEHFLQHAHGKAICLPPGIAGSHTHMKACILMLFCKSKCSFVVLLPHL